MSSWAAGSGGGSDLVRGEVFIGAVLTKLVIRSGTEAGVTFSTTINAGRSRIVVGSS